MLSQVSTADLLAELRRRREAGLAEDPDAALVQRIVAKASEVTGIPATTLYSRCRFSARVSETRTAVWQALYKAGIHKNEIARLFRRTEACVRAALHRSVPFDLLHALTRPVQSPCGLIETALPISNLQSPINNNQSPISNLQS
jgi:hypothetical protein